VTREQLEHIIRAAGSITSEDRIVIIGSQAILGAYPNTPYSCYNTLLPGPYMNVGGDARDVVRHFSRQDIAAIAIIW
jgi:hypothetical protein